MKAISDASFLLLIEKMEMFMILSTRFKRALKPILLETIYKKGSRILNFHQRQQFAWFLEDGLAREIRVDEWTFAEKTVWFWFPFSFLYTTPGFFGQEPSETTIEILQDSHVVLLSYADWYNLKQQFKETEILTEKIRGADLLQKSIHANNVKYLTTEELYLENRSLMNKLFGLTKRKYIAEFMGMSVDRLGKLRRRY